MNRFDSLYFKIINECKENQIIEESFGLEDIKSIAKKIKEKFINIKNFVKGSLKKFADYILGNKAVEKIVEKTNLKNKSEELFDKMFKTTEKDGVLTVEINEKNASQVFQDAFKQPVATESIDLKDLGAKIYGSTVFAGFSGLNYFIPYLWCISLFLIVAPILTNKIISWRKSKIVHYRIRSNEKIIIDTDDYDEFSKTLTSVIESNCDFCAQSYMNKYSGVLSNFKQESLIDSVSNDNHRYSSSGYVNA